MSLRDRNRRAAMRAIQDAALDLFEERGFDAVSVEDVAAAAGASPSTVYRRFGTKERLVLHDEQDARLDAELVRALGSLDRDAPLAALGDAFVAAFEDLDPAELALQRRRGALVDAEPALAAALVAEIDHGREELAGGLRAALRRARTELECDVLARVAFAAFIAGFEAWQRAWPSGSLPRTIRRAFDAAERVTGG
ncbi:MAG: TetR family transcriptional regulator [Planctomycetota bacterium]